MDINIDMMDPIEDIMNVGMIGPTGTTLEALGEIKSDFDKYYEGIKKSKGKSAIRDRKYKRRWHRITLGAVYVGDWEYD